MGTGSPLSDLRLPTFLSRSGVKERPTHASSGGDAKMRGGMCPRSKAVQHKALRDTTGDASGSHWYPPVGHLPPAHLWVTFLQPTCGSPFLGKPREIRSAYFSRAAAPPLPGPAPSAWASRGSFELPTSDGENPNPAPPKPLRPETAEMRGGKGAEHRGLWLEGAEHGGSGWKGLSGRSGREGGGSAEKSGEAPGG